MKVSTKQEKAIKELMKYYPLISPENLSVEGSLDLFGTQITSLPDNLSVGGNINLSGTPITSLPDNLKIGGGLYISGTQITSLPDNLSVGASILIKYNKITSSTNWIISAIIGSRQEKTIYDIKNDIVRCGCFKGDLKEFKERVYSIYPEGHYHRLEYSRYIDEIEQQKLNKSAYYTGKKPYKLLITTS